MIFHASGSLSTIIANQGVSWTAEAASVETREAAERQTMRTNLGLHEVLLLGYCVVSNHFHLIVIAIEAKIDSLTLAVHAFWVAPSPKVQGRRWLRRSSPITRELQT